LTDWGGCAPPTPSEPLSSAISSSGWWISQAAHAKCIEGQLFRDGALYANALHCIGCGRSVPRGALVLQSGGGTYSVREIPSE